MTEIKPGDVVEITAVVVSIDDTNIRARPVQAIDSLFDTYDYTPVLETFLLPGNCPIAKRFSPHPGQKVRYRGVSGYQIHSLLAEHIVLLQQENGRTDDLETFIVANLTDLILYNERLCVPEENHSDEWVDEVLVPDVVQPQAVGLEEPRYNEEILLDYPIEYSGTPFENVDPILENQDSAFAGETTPMQGAMTRLQDITFVLSKDEVETRVPDLTSNMDNWRFENIPLEGSNTALPEAEDSTGRRRQMAACLADLLKRDAPSES